MLLCFRAQLCAPTEPRLLPTVATALPEHSVHKKVPQSRRAPPPTHSDMFSILDTSPLDGDLLTQPPSSLNIRLIVNNPDCVANPALEAFVGRVGASLDWDQSRTRSACQISSRKEAVRNRGSRSSHLCPRSPKREELPFPKANTLALFTGSGLEHRSPPPPRPAPP